MAKKKKEKQITDILLVIDSSGSMAPLRGDVIGSVNTFIEAQQKDGDDARLTIIKFNARVTRTHELIPLNEFKPYTLKDYTPEGLTALNDAIGNGISFITSMNTNNQVVVFIMTDGAENASTDYTPNRVKELVEACTAKGWSFTFAAANIDAFQVGGNLGFSAASTISFNATSQGIDATLRSAATTVSYARAVMRDKD